MDSVMRMRDGSLECPKCGGKSFTEKHRGKNFLALGGLGWLFGPKALKCNNCWATLEKPPTKLAG